MRHRLTRAQDRATGRELFGYRYADLAERVALEFEDLAIRRPTLRLCRLCRRPFVPLRRGESYSASNLWRRRDRRPLAACVPAEQLAEFERAEQEHESDYRRLRKNAWTAMRREVKRHGEGSRRASKARERWEEWKQDDPNPSPRSPGRPREMPDLTPPSIPPNERSHDG